MCFVMHLPVSVVDCPMRMSKNLHPGFNNAPYSEFKLIFFTSCLLSQNSCSTLFPASMACCSLLCISFLSAYQRSNSPGITPANSCENIVPFALRNHGCPCSNIKSYTSAALNMFDSPVSQSIVMLCALSFRMTA